MWRELQTWIMSLTLGETWIVGGVFSLVVWLGFILPVWYRLMWVPHVSPPFLTRMGQDPLGAVMLIGIIFACGPMLIWLSFLAIPFMICIWIFKVIFRAMLSAVTQDP